MQLRQGTIRLFRFAGVEVFLHWAWFVIAMFEINGGLGGYSSKAWNGIEYLGLFAIVLVHEFGHALACRSVGGTANRIVLWPLGGVAFVDPPPRPGATLWSIAAGPLVNVVFVPLFLAAGYLLDAAGAYAAIPNLHPLLIALAKINFGLLIFNLLPIYPLDGGQILRSLLWFVLGRGRSLQVATVFGFIGVAGLAVLAFYAQSVWIGLIAAFALMNCLSGWKQAQLLLQIAKIPRRAEYSCPTCHSSPPIGEFWKCNLCMNAFDTFQTQAKCPVCSANFPDTTCLDCHRRSPFAEWAPTVVQSTNA